MLKTEKIKLLRDLITDLTPEEVIWLNGYFAALAEREKTPVEKLPVEIDVNEAVNKITIAYGTESGNAKKLATALAGKVKKKGLSTKLVGLDQYKLTELPKEDFFVTIISTQGEGEPPATAKKFYDHIHQPNLSLHRLKYGVLALGDTAYPLFCKAGEDVDAQFQKLGAQRVVPLQKLDTDYETEAEDWFEALLQSVTATQQPIVKQTAVANKTGKLFYSGTVTNNVNLNGRGSKKQTHHIEIATEGVAYSPGDAVSVVPQNDGALVNKIFSLLGLNAETKVLYKNEQHNVVELLRTKLSITHLPERVIKKYGEVVGQEIPPTRMDLLDLLRIYPVTDGQQFSSVLHVLEPITPRLYSISSSPSAHGGEVHLTVGQHSFDAAGQQKTGLCSDYLLSLKRGEPLSFYIHRNHAFKLPAADQDIIMIGPGTGIAPFRSFVAERDAQGATGRNWLFFGDQHFTTDFLYQTEWQDWLNTGTLTKMNVAFSRDGNEKLYVQHKMLQHASEFYAWVEGGAYVYVCGAKEPMSVDVENEFVQIIKGQKKCSDESAADYVQALKDTGRFLKDVY